VAIGLQGPHRRLDGSGTPYENTGKALQQGPTKAEQSPSTVTIEIPNNAREFEHAGKRNKVVGQQGSVHEQDKSGVLEADAIER
jgi:hypothetical protein